ncbi:mechanosensitive ion channel family protein [Microvirga sp. BT325]|uniref:Mechanosensitive ion channel family protein n=1 Tax=Microvirga splendida TaxID=2795727 RepID=A0ABS0XVS9_9HYPH|nr:mechanosensitive ion channel family protein [Microvirga splendida]
MKRLLGAAVIVLATAVGGASDAQQAPNAPKPQAQVPAQPQPQAAPAPLPAAAAPAPATVSAETKAARAKLDGYKADLEQKEAAIQSRTMADADLQTIRQQIEPIITDIRTVVEEQAPRLEASRQRLSQLGPKPEKGQPEESADVARDRAEREAAVAELDETQRLGRALLVQAEQLSTQIGDLRRTGFARALFEQSDGLFSPGLWMRVAQALPRELRALGVVAEDALDQFRRNTTLGVLLLLGLAIGAAIALYAGRRSIAPRLVRRDRAINDPSRRSRLLAALGVLVLGAGPAIAGSWVVWAAFDSADIVPPRLELVGRALLSGLAFIAIVRALIDAILAPDHTSWRLIPVRDASADRIMHFSVTLATVMVVGKVIEAFNKAVAAALPITVITRAVFALAAALVFAELLRRFAARESQDEACLGPYVPQEVDIGGPLRSLGWFVVALIIGSVLGGYIALASFLVDQAVGISLIIALLALGIAFADEFIGGSLRGQSRIATTLQANTGLRRRSLEQIGILVSGVARLALILIAVLLVLLPWGIDSADVTGSLRTLFFGFNVGDVTISVSSILIAAALFAGGFAVTRIIQRWLNNTFLPATELDAGLRNSISTAAGYVGIIIAGVMAFTYLGLSLERVTIVAGALSVGIGFGLQSIVNNFISGLILLWERPIRVGDLVVVGDGEGYVRRINVRSTEIQAFDRSTIIVPNSNLISGIVRNRVRNDRVGRVLVSVPVPRASDPDQVAEIMRKAALAHREIMSEPAPRVLFKKVTENTIEFDLICFVDDIDAAGRVSSDIYFEIFRGLRRAGIGVPAPAPAPAPEPEPEDEPKGKTPKPEEKEDETLTLLKDKTPA